MPNKICLAASTLYYPKGGGHLWAYLNWALGLKSNGYEIIWLEGIANTKLHSDNIFYLNTLKNKLLKFGITQIAFWHWDLEKPHHQVYDGFSRIEEIATGCEFILNQNYSMPDRIIKLFRKSVLLDIDPGLLQMWISKSQIKMYPHDIYFTIGETVGAAGALFKSGGIKWNYIPPCISLEHWPIVSEKNDDRYTTITHWQMKIWEEDNGILYNNEKRAGFLPYLQLPNHTSQKLELAICLSEEELEEKQMLSKLGWNVVDSHIVSATPEDYQKYIQLSKGEFSCAKPSCIRLQNAWISDRTICYLASGKPAIIENTGRSRFLPDREGVLRFSNFTEALQCIEDANLNYDFHAIRARKLAEEYFSATKVASKLIEKVIC